MPGIQGDELCSIIKNNPGTAGIPVILLTAKATHDAIVNGIEKGADDYIAKPFSLEILNSKVRGMRHNRKRKLKLTNRPQKNKPTTIKYVKCRHPTEYLSIRLLI